MKQKIKIMKSKPELSDQEIKSYMDFDGLLARQKQQTSIPLSNMWRWGVLIIAIGSISLWWFLQEEGIERSDSQAITEKIVENKAQADQPVIENKSTAQSPQEKETDRNVKKSNAQSPVTPEIRKETKPET